jgi:PPE-repeat protein
VTVNALRRTRRWLLSLLVALLALASGWGNAEADSKWALVFLGDRVWSGDIRAVGLGSDMQLIEDSLALQLNPATTANVNKFTFAADGYFSSDRGSSEEFNETDASFTFSSFIFAVPLLKRLSVGLGYRGRYNAPSGIVFIDETDGGKAFGQFYSRSGGLISFPFLAGLRVTSYLQLGGTISIERGNYENSWRIEFQDPTYNVALSTQTWDMKGTGYSAGLVLRPPGGLSLGVTWESEIEYDTDVREQFTNPISNKKYNETSLLPERWTVSGLWQFHRKLALYGTWSYSDFTKFSGMAFLSDRLYEQHFISGGFEFLRAIPMRKSRLPIRLGASFTQLPYDNPAGTRVDSYLVDLGSGWISRSGKAKIDITLQGGVTGSVETNGLENRVFRIYIGLSGAEEWRRHKQTEF